MWYKKKVSEEEFWEYVKTYPVKLERDVELIPDPPMVCYNDFSDDQVWPQSRRAWYTIERNGTRTGWTICV